MSRAGLERSPVFEPHTSLPDSDMTVSDKLGTVQPMGSGNVQF